MAVKTVNVTLDGKVTTLTLNPSTGLYEATLTAPDKSSYKQTGGYYNMSITATIMTKRMRGPRGCSMILRIL